MEYYSAVKRNGLLICTNWINFEKNQGVMMSEKNSKRKHTVISFTHSYELEAQLRWQHDEPEALSSNPSTTWKKTIYTFLKYQTYKNGEACGQKVQWEPSLHLGCISTSTVILFFSFARHYHWEKIGKEHRGPQSVFSHK